jgi:DhnA family fructose-bisphosphate aldolase class Ia
VTMSGKQLRLQRIFPEGRRGLFSVPLDHTVSMGPIDGLESVASVARELQEGGVDLVIVTKGAVREVAPVLKPATLLGVHMSASTSLGPRPDHKRRVGGAAEAVALGGDLLSVQVNFGVPEEGEMLADLGVSVDECRALGLPLLCMAYVKKPGGGTPDDLRHACRAAADLGADIVKTSYLGGAGEFRALIRSTPVPVLIGGGIRSGTDDEFLGQVADSLAAGARGICIGRNLFQRSPLLPLARRLEALLHTDPGTRS